MIIWTPLEVIRMTHGYLG